MHLGTLITRLGNEADAALALEALGDIVLYTEVVEMGERFGEAPGDYVAAAARRFAAAAGDEDWLGLVSAIERAPQPGAAALDRMLRWALSRDAADEAAVETGTHAAAGAQSTAAAGRCGCGAGGGCHDPT